MGLRGRPVDGPYGKAAVVAGVRAQTWPMIADGRVRPIVARHASRWPTPAKAHATAGSRRRGREAAARRRPRGDWRAAARTGHMTASSATCNESARDSDGEQQVLVVGPTAARWAWPRSPQARTDDEPEGVGSMVEQPAKVMRIGTMIKQLLEEVRAAPLDEASRGAAQGDPRELHQGARGRPGAGAARGAGPAGLPFTEDVVPSEGELRIAQAQLVGWLEGLFHGIQTALFAQQMAARAQLEQMRRGLPAGAVPPGRPRAASDGARASTCSARCGGRSAWGGCRSVPLPYPRTVAQTVTADDERAPDRAARHRRSGPTQWSRRSATSARAGSSARCGATWAGRTSSSATAARCSGPLWIAISMARHRRRDGHPLRRAVRRGHPHVPAVRGHRAADLELHPGLHPRGQRGLHRQRGPDQVPAGAAHRCTSTGWSGGRRCSSCTTWSSGSCW